jgi:hypothetical protein
MQGFEEDFYFEAFFEGERSAFEGDRLALVFLLVGSFVRSTSFPFFMTQTGVPVCSPSSSARFAARRSAREIFAVSRACELSRWPITYLGFTPVESNRRVTPELSYHHHSSTKFL